MITAMTQFVAVFSDIITVGKLWSAADETANHLLLCRAHLPDRYSPVHGTTYLKSSRSYSSSASFCGRPSRSIIACIQILHLICTRHKLLNRNVARCPCSVSVLFSPAQEAIHLLLLCSLPFVSRRQSYLYLLLDHLLASVCQVPSFGSSVCMLSPGMHTHAADQRWRCHIVDL
jgi:hypothetical protein